MLPVLSWWISSTYRYSCSTVHCVAFGPRAVRARRRRARRRARTRAGRCGASSIHLAGNPALEAEHAQLGVGAVVVDEAREEQRRQRLPARVARLPQRFLERRLVRVHEALRQVVDRLPDALGELGRAVVVLDVLLDELAAVGAERGVEELDRLHAREVDRPARLAHRVEGAHHVLLATDDIERRQLAQPAGHGLRRGQRIGDFLGSGCQKSEHDASHCTSAARVPCACVLDGTRSAREVRSRRRNQHL